MQQKIHILSDEAINQIPAGEVIESPASVVKELIENSLDAGAKKITIEITGGGLKMIRISDDGVGMGREDALLSIQRHATSKIKSSHDLFHILTQGFRGEALAAVSSISKMVLMTAEEGAVGTRLEIEKGEVVKVTFCAHMWHHDRGAGSLLLCSGKEAVSKVCGIDCGRDFSERSPI